MTLLASVSKISQVYSLLGGRDYRNLAGSEALEGRMLMIRWSECGGFRAEGERGEVGGRRGYWGRGSRLDCEARSAGSDHRPHRVCWGAFLTQYTASLFRSERPCLLSMERTIAVTLCHRSDRIFQNEIHLQTGGETPATCVEWVIAQHEDYSRKLTLYTGPHVLRLSIPHHMEGDLVSCGIMGWVGKQLLMNYSSRRLSHPDHPERSTTHRNARMTRISSSMCIHKVYHSDVLAESQDNRRMTLVNTCEQEYMAHASFSDRDRDRVCDSRDISLSLNTLYPTFYFNLPTLFNALPYVCCMYTNTLCIDCSYGGVRYKFLFLPGISFTLFSTPEHRAASEYGASEVVVVCWLGGDGGVRW
ncbi:hypothetical protein Tco_1448154 [Tanacetum coccineum]